MPHIFLNRSRRFDLFVSAFETGRTAVWEGVNAVVYVLGGAVFVLGSVMFFPAFAGDIDLGVWAFLIGSLFYLIVTLHDLVEVLRHRISVPRSRLERRLEIVAAIGYTSGTVLFTVGSVFFFDFVGRIDAGAWCFIIGSGLFVVSAFVNVLQTHDDKFLARKLWNLTAVTFVAGSVLFTTASIPYLWPLGDSAFATTLLTFLAAQYLVGSVLFLAGGVFNFSRAWSGLMAEARGGRGHTINSGRRTGHDSTG